MNEDGDQQAPTEGRVARRQRRNRDALVAAARDIMTEKGVEAATMLEIADRADVGAGTVYNYFKSKDELAIAVLETLMHDLALRIQAVTDRFEDPAQVYAYGIRTVLDTATGDVRPEEIVRETLARHELSAVEKWVQEVCWRSYWKGWLEMRPQVWRSWRHRVDELRASLPNDVLSRAQEVSEGRSGVAVMDHFACELRETGYLHNHARMRWASFWIHAERLAWELGADFFFQHLLDADPASNTLSWRWVAGLQTAGKTYFVRRSNLERYCEASLLEDTAGLERLEDGRLTPIVLTDHADLTRQALPEMPTACPQLSGRIGLWIHADDLCLENSPLARLRPASVVALTSAETYARYGLSEQRIQSIQTALRDGLTRAGAHFDCTTSLSDTPSTAVGIKAWVESEKLDAVIAMAPNVGPVADGLPSVLQPDPVVPDLAEFLAIDHWPSPEW